MDDLYSSLENQGFLLLSDNAKESIDHICHTNLEDSYEDFDEHYLDALAITREKILTVYGDFQKTYPCNHVYHQYFNLEDYSIDWDGLTEQIYENSKSFVKGSPEYRAFSFPEVKKKVNNMKEFYEELKHDYPDFDSKTLACRLEQYRMVEVDVNLDHDLLTPITLASVDSFSNIIKYRNFNDKVLFSEKDQKAIDYHEDFYIFVSGCVDKNYGGDGQFSRHSNAVGIQSIPWDDMQCFEYSFLEEIYAELYSKEKMDMKQEAYSCYDEVLDILQLVLGKNDDYMIDQILTDMVYQDPLSFIRHFLVYGDEEQYFIDNLRMLKSFDMVLEPNIFYLISLGDELDWKYINTLKNSAFYHLSKMFFSNLIVMNEKHADEMTLEDNYSMIELFCQYLKQADEAIQLNSFYFGSDQFFSQNEYGSTIDVTYQEQRSIFFDYLMEKYQIERFDLLKQYCDFIDDGMEDYTFPSFMGEAKAQYYQKLFMEKERTIFEDRGITLQKVNPYNLLTNGKDK